MFIPPEQLHGPEHQTKNGVHVIDTPDKARRLAYFLERHWPLAAIDAETVDVNPRKESPVGRGRIVCFGLAHGSSAGTQRYFIWWRPEIVVQFKRWLESDAPKVNANIWTFDRHVFNNMGIELNGIIGDITRIAKFWRTDQRFKADLKTLMGHAFGYKLGKFNDLFKRPKGLKLFRSDKVRDTKRQIGDGENVPKRKVPTVVGTEYQNVSWSQTEYIPLDDIPTMYPERLITLYDYASLDAKAALELWPYFRQKLTHDQCKTYDEFWNPGCKRWSDMERLGIRLDLDRVNQASRVADKHRRHLESNLREWYPKSGFNFGSDSQLSWLLYEYKGLPIPRVMGSRKAIKINRERKPSTSQASLEWLAQECDLPELRTLLKWRAASADCIRLRSYEKFVDADSRLHSVMAPTCDTGRATSKLPALQQIPSAERDIYGIRNCFVASPGNKLVVADYSQLELYVLAHYLIKWFDDHRLAEALESGDVHSNIARMAWPHLAKYTGNLKQYSKKIQKYRSDVKNIVYGINYGKTASGLGVSIKDDHGNRIGRAKAQELIDVIMAATGIDKYQSRTINYARHHGFVGTLGGRRRPIPEIHSHERGIRGSGERKALNSPIQGGAADIVQQAMNRIEDYLVLQVHDELILDVPESEVEHQCEVLRKAMTEPMFGLTVPLKIDMHVCDNWGEAK